jgi:hypothetical protein
LASGHWFWQVVVFKLAGRHGLPWAYAEARSVAKIIWKDQEAMIEPADEEFVA